MTFLHKDPFDHLLLAQALCEQIPLMTADPQLKQYRVKLMWCA